MERSEVFGLPRSQNTQKWREHLVSLARNSREARLNVDMSDQEWNKQWDMLMKPGVYEVTVADMLLPALSHALGLDILIFNTFKASRIPPFHFGALFFLMLETSLTKCYSDITFIYNGGLMSWDVYF